MIKQNILMILSEYPNINKSSNLYSDLAEALKSHGYNVTVVVTEESRNIKSTQLLKENGIDVLRVRVGNIYNVGLLEKGITYMKIGILTKMAILKHFSKSQFDLILFMSPPLTIINTVKWAMNKFKCSSYLMMKDIFPQNAVDLGIILKNSIIYYYFKRQEKKLYTVPTTIGCMSKMNKKYLLQHNDFLNNVKIEIFPNTQKLQKKYIRNTEYTLRKKYGIPTDTVLAIYGGNLGKPQGVDFFMEVLESYKNNSNISFLIISRGTEKDKLYNFVDKNNIKNVYKFELMPRKDYEEILKECDIGLIFLDKRFTIPNFPSKILSYFNISIPVMAAIDVNNDFGEMIDKTNSGYWVESGDIKSYINKFDKLIQDKNLRISMGKNGRKCMETQFSVENSVKIIDTYLNKRKEDKNV